MTDYYDINLKYARQNILLKNPNFSTTEGMLEDNEKLDAFGFLRTFEFTGDK